MSLLRFFFFFIHSLCCPESNQAAETSVGLVHPPTGAMPTVILGNIHHRHHHQLQLHHHHHQFLTQAIWRRRVRVNEHHWQSTFADEFVLRYELKPGVGYASTLKGVPFIDVQCPVTLHYNAYVISSAK